MPEILRLWWPRCASFIFAFALGAVGSGAATAMHGKGGADQRIELTQARCVIGSDRPLSLAQAEAMGAWSCTSDLDALENDYTWLRFDGDILPHGQHFSLTSDASAFSGLRYVVQFGDGHRRGAHLTADDLARAWQPQTRFAVPLYGAQERPAALYVRIDKPLTVLNAGQLALQPSAHMEENRLRTMVLFGLFIGMMLLAGLYSAIIFGGLRNKFAIWHLVLALLFVTYTMSSGSMIFLLWPDITLAQRTDLSYVSLSLAGASVMPFFFSFVSRRHVLPRWRWLMVVGLAMLVGNAFLMPLVGPHIPFLIQPLYHLLFVPPLTIFVGAVASAWMQGSKPVRWIAAAWALPTAFALERALRGMNLYPPKYEWDHGFYYTLAYMAITMAFAVSWRVRDLRRDRDRAVAVGSELNRQALSDGLTGLPNRRSFEQRHWRDGDFLAIVDVDLFKAVNDDFGHQAGDDVLRTIGHCLLADTAQGRLIGAWRLGGEEFAVLVAAADVAGAAIALNAIRSRMSDEIGRSVEEVTRPVTLSMGLAKIGRGRIDAAYREADRALYRAKSSGRDRLSYENHGSVLATIFPKRAA